ncbi:hypothetical protein HDU90_001880 [Geranomyces variabilis]|nr:hypothetical protein HDU90_001880 [Geranomyces variabilis]
MYRYQAKLEERINSTSEKDLRRELFKLRTQAKSGQCQITAEHEDVMLDAQVEKEARPAAVIGVRLVTDHLLERHKRPIDTSAPEPAKNGESTPKKANRLSLSYTPGKPSLVINPAVNHKHRLSAEVVAVMRANRDSVAPEHAEYLTLMDKERSTRYCPDVVAKMLVNLAKSEIANNNALDALTRALRTRCEDAEEEKAYHISLAMASDFFFMVRFAPNATLMAHNEERKYLIEQISVALKSIERTYGILAFRWVEVQTRATKGISIAENPGSAKGTTYNVDVIGVIGADRTELCFIEH